MKLNKILILLLLFGLIVSINCVSATDDVNKNTYINGINNSNLENNPLIQQKNIIADNSIPKREGSLSELEQEAITAMEKGETLNLTKNYKYKDGDHRYGISIYDKLVINGNNHTINGGNYVSLFEVKNGGNLIINNLNIEYCYSDYGGAIYKHDGGSLSLNNCTFTNCIAYNLGGAIYNNYGTLNINNCIFTNCSAYGNDGGAIYSTGNVNCHNCIFKNNYAHQDGGAIFASSTFSDKFVYIYSCTFIDNVAEGSGYDCEGGAIYCDCIGACINSTFRNNKAEYGGAIHINSDCDATIKNCIFRSNVATKKGGAIFGDDVKIHLHIIHNMFICNYAGDREHVGEGNDIYNYGYYDSIKYNYYETINSNYSFIEHKYWPNDNENHNDSNPCKTLEEYNKIGD